MAYIQKGLDSASTVLLLGFFPSGSTKVELKSKPKISDKLTARRFLQNPTGLSSGYFLHSLLKGLDVKSKAHNAVSSFENSIKNIKEVSRIAYKITENIVTIWTFSKKNDRKILYKIYNIEQKMIDNHPSLIFDFTVIFSPTKSIPSDMTVERI